MSPELFKQINSSIDEAVQVFQDGVSGRVANERISSVLSVLTGFVKDDIHATLRAELIRESKVEAKRIVLGVIDELIDGKL